jgi:uncharacterized membrane protein
MDYSSVLVSWIHITSAVLLVGGTFFFRVVLLKWAGREGGLSDALRDRVATRWIHTAGGLLLVLLITGLISMSLRMESWKVGAYENTLKPHAIFGIKFLVVVVIGVLIFAAAKIKSKRPVILLVNSLLGITVILLSVWLTKSYRVPSPVELEAHRAAKVAETRVLTPNAGSE